MDTKIEKAIEFLAGKVSGGVTADEALKFTQAALNLAHVQATFANTRQTIANTRKHLSA